MSFLKELNDNLVEFIKNQKIFFVGTAANEGTVNISPKGIDTFRVVSPSKILWLNLTGSGNETAAHLIKNDRMTILFCSFDETPLILRLYGKSKIYHTEDLEFKEFYDLFPKLPGARQIIEMEVELVQTSCGYAVPFMDFKTERNKLNKWAEDQGDELLEKYWEEKNNKSIDGFKTKK